MDVWRAEGLPVSVEVAGWPTFDGGEDLGFSIEYPTGWVVDLTDEDGLSINTPGSGSSFGVYRTRNINPDMLPISDWYEVGPGPNFAPDALDEEYIIVGGHDAVRIRVPSFFTDKTHIYIADGRDIIEVIYDDVPGLLADYEDIVQSISLAQ